MGMIEFIKNGGLVMIPLLGGMIIAIALIVDRFFALKDFSKQIRLIDPIAEQLLKNQTIFIPSELETQNGPIAAILKNGLHHLQAKPELLTNTLKLAFYQHAESLQKHLSTIKIIGAIMPMLGLLGSVDGMIHVFSSISQSGVGNPQVMAHGVSEALIATKTGLAGAILILFCHNLLLNRVENLMTHIQRTVTIFQHYALTHQKQDA